MIPLAGGLAEHHLGLVSLGKPISLGKTQHFGDAIGQCVQAFFGRAAWHRVKCRLFCPYHQKPIRKTVCHFPLAHQFSKFARRDMAQQIDMRVAGVNWRGLGRRLDACTVPGFTQSCGQRVAVACPLMQDVRKFGFKHKQPLVVNRLDLVLGDHVAIVNHHDHTLAARQTAGVHLESDIWMLDRKVLDNARHQLGRCTFAPTTRTSDMQAKNTRVMPVITYGQIAATAHASRQRHDCGQPGSVGIDLSVCGFGLACNVTDQSV